jgi:7-keto-8-aminopelargonate synthetase-like enzyme
MKRIRLTAQLKQKLIQQSIQRNLKKSITAYESGNLADSLPRDATELTDFTRHPGFQQVSIIREAGARLGVPNPFFRVHDSTAGATTQIGGESCLNFASYNYLGLCGHPLVNEAAIKAVDR